MIDIFAWKPNAKERDIASWNFL